jgi:geranylgeranyl diphosphate synthase type II
LTAYAEGIGLAFQIRDDILDVEGSFSKLGKQTGCDSARGKSTFITLYGLDESRRMLSEITEKAVDSLALFGEKADFLKNLAWMLAKRDH